MQTTREELAEIVESAVKRALAYIDPDTHAQHHAAIQMWVERENRRRKMYDTVRASVLGWFVIMVLGGLGVAVGSSVLRLLNKGGT